MKSLLRFSLVVSACLLFLGGTVSASSPNGIAGAMPAYYDGRLFLINFKELSPTAEQTVLAGNQSVNTIFMSEDTLPGGAPFVSVLDAIQADGFNPLWQEVQITFEPGVTPYQITRDDDVTAAAERGDIELSSKDEVYRCSVIGASVPAGATGVTTAAATLPSRPAAGATTGAEGSANGSGGDMPAYYDGRLFTINFKKEPEDAAAALLAQNASINVIYMSDPGLPGGQPFDAVLDAIQGDGFNPLWLEVQITFNPGVTPHQLTRDDDILDAAANGEITLSSEGEVYRCSVVGAKK